MEALFGTGSVWPAPSVGFGFQAPFGVSSRPLAVPFGPASVSTATALPAGPALSPQAAFPFATNPLLYTGPLGVEPAAGVTAPALLAEVALRRGQPQGPANDQDVEDFIYDAFELLPGTSDVEVRCEGGRVTLTGTVQHKRVKRDVGEIAWAIPVLHDVQNNVTIASRRRARSAGRETETPQSSAGRKQG